MVTKLSFPDTILHYSLLSYDTLLPKTTPYHDNEGLRYLQVPGQENYSTDLREIVGCCNGLFCIADRSRRDSSADLILWNPSTSETKLLPHHKSDSKYITSGFGFDSSTRDYKVLRIHKDGTDMCSAVYSLRNDSWKEVNGAKDELKIFDSTIRFDWMYNKSNRGKIYGYSPLSNDIVCFDFREERFTNQVFPRGLVNGAHYWQIHLAATCKEDSLVAVVRDEDDNFEIWGLLRYQSVESWTKLFCCEGSRFSGSIGEGSRMIGVSGDVSVALIVKATSELLKIDFEKEEVSDDNGIRALNKSRAFINSHVFKAYSYVPSRVSIAGLSTRNRG
ncbi:F-box protein CPR1 [Linum grandiflorum]